MKITAESTSKIVDLVVRRTTGPDVTVPARIWEAVTEGGVPCHLYVTRVAVAKGSDTSQFERELVEQKAPSAGIQAIPLRMIL